MNILRKIYLLHISREKLKRKKLIYNFCSCTGNIHCDGFSSKLSKLSPSAIRLYR